MSNRVWMVTDGIEAEDGGPCTEWWLVPYVPHPHEEPCPITGESSLVAEEEVHGWRDTPEMKGPYGSASTAERWARHYNRKERG